MIITISGTPGTGKTEVSKRLAVLLGYQYIDLNNFARNAGFISGRDDEREADEIDIERLKETQMEDNIVVDGHLSHYVNSDVSIVLRTDPDELRKRLEKRDWSSRKIDENFEAEIMGVCSVESREINDKIIDFDTTGEEPSKVAEIITNQVKGNKLETDPIDWDMEKYL